MNEKKGLITTLEQNLRNATAMVFSFAKEGMIKFETGSSFVIFLYKYL
jgi:hypothetical protein